MLDDWYNSDPEDGFNPEDHGVEMDEIAKMYAVADMENEQKIWARKQAEKFYGDFESLSTKEAILSVKALIKAGTVTKDDAITLMDNMIQVFEETEDYEKCHVCLKIKKGIL